MRMVLTTILAAALLRGIVPVSAQTWQRTTAPTDFWRSVATSADGKQIVAAGISGHVFISTNYGRAGSNQECRKLNGIRPRLQPMAAGLLLQAITSKTAPGGFILPLITEQLGCPTVCLKRTGRLLPVPLMALN